MKSIQHPLSDQQKDICQWFEWSPTIRAYGRPNLVVRARAGTGKTFTIEQALAYAPEGKIRYCAFNKRIADEFVTRGTRAEVKTLHASGLGCVRLYWPDVKVSMSSDRENALAHSVCGSRAPDPIKRLVAKLHTKGREIAPHATELGDLTNIQFQFELAPDDEWISVGFDAAYVETKALEAMELAASRKPVETGIDGSDMIFLPVRNHWLRKMADAVVVDEAQDMTVAQLEIAVGICRGRIIIVGDDRQAIYGFRGADSGSLDRLKRELNAEELPLTTTYRCGRRIVELAQMLVPDFQAGPNNPDGEISDLDGPKLVGAVGPGDFILSRLNAPLISVAMSLLRAGKRTQVAGRDIGAGLTGLVRKLRAKTVEEFLERLSIWEEREVARLRHAKREQLIESVQDRAGMLVELCSGADSMEQVINSIDALFQDDGLGANGLITCSSVHKAKGLEANRVFILKDTLRSHNQEELNIQYVAITRAKQSLVWVHGIGGRK